MTSDRISQMLCKHYTRTLSEHGPSPRGVDWGSDPADHALRLDCMLAVLKVVDLSARRYTLLDVGCGYGSLLDLIKSRNLPVNYSGIDVSEAMIEEARKRHADIDWRVKDALKLEASEQYDFVVCNGVLTQKLDVSIKEMDEFARALVAQMFRLCRIGVAFNVMTTHVNYMVPNLYYRNPVELLGWCMTQLTSRVKLDHAYPLYEYTIYLYREDAPEMAFGSHRRGRQDRES